MSDFNFFETLVNSHPVTRMNKVIYQYGKDKMKDIAYSVMNMGNTNRSARGISRSSEDIKQAVINSGTWASPEQRALVPRNVASLYIFGNDLGQFVERPDLRYAGVEYDKILRESGKDPDDVKTYEGEIISPNLSDYGTVQLPPEVLDQDLINYINSKHNKTYYKMKRSSEPGDGVGNFASRLSVVNGQPSFVHSDLYDFDTKYIDRYQNKINDPNLKYKVQALDMVGTPFALKQAIPVKKVYDSDYMPKNQVEEDILTATGHHTTLPEIIVNAKRKSK